MTLEKEEVIIVGGGLSGLVLAKALLNNNIKPLILEKNNNPTSKSYSTVIDFNLLSDLFKGLNKKLGERKIFKVNSYILNDNSIIASTNEHKVEESYKTVLCNEFLDFIVKDIEKHGAKFKTHTHVEELIIENSKITGVKTNSEEIFSNVVVIAEGLPSILTKYSGLREGELTSEETFLFIEESFIFSEEEINKKFQINSSDGILYRFFLSLPERGIGYLHTNNNSITLGCGILISDLIKSEINIQHSYERFKSHSFIKNIIDEKKSKHYKSFILPGNLANNIVPIPRIFTSGCLLVGSGATFSNPFDFSFLNMPIISSKIASEVILDAIKKNDFSSLTLSSYRDKLLENSKFSFYKNKLNNFHCSSLFNSNYENESKAIELLNLYTSNSEAELVYGKH